VSRTELRYLEGKSLRATLPDGASELRIIIEGDRCLLAGRVRRAFPSSQPDAFFSVQDGEGKEVGVLRSLDELDPASQAAVKGQLERRYFTPKIKRVLSLKQDGGMWLFKVATQRGEVSFYVRTWRDSSHEVRPGRWVILSVDGQRYEISDWGALDGQSKTLLEQLF
jgi:hypothetical protein